MEPVLGGKSFRWSGRYDGDLSVAQTLDTQLNVLAAFEPSLPPTYRATPFVFLANTAPANQLPVLTPQVYVGGTRVCDADTDLGLDWTLDRLLDREGGAQ